jgi:putative cardiolipin synthase
MNSEEQPKEKYYQEGSQMMFRNPRGAFLIILGIFLISGCAALPKDFERPISYAYTETSDTRLARMRSAQGPASQEHSGFLLLGNGLDAFVARAVLATAADRSIDVQYYLFHNDLVGTLMIDQLLKAADRGVRVRLLVDDMDMGGRDLGAAALDSHPHIEVRFFNPFTRNTSRMMQFLTRYGSVTRRMHNKSFTVDNQATILGGRNIGNEYFDAHPDLAFSDLDVLAIGPVVKDVSASFDLYWNSEFSYPASALKGDFPAPEEVAQKRQALNKYIAAQKDSAYLKALRNSNLAGQLRRNEVRFEWGEGKVVHDFPEKLLHDKSRTDLHLSTQMSPYVDQINEELIIFSPYFVPEDAGVASLTAYRDRGVRVRILTNSLASNDVAIVHSGYAKYRKALLRAGIELYELNKKMGKKEKREIEGPHDSSKASLHAKSFVFDREQVFIGSLNLDPIAIYNNTEIGLVITQKTIANGMGEWFDQNIDKLAFRLELIADETGREKILWHGRESGKEVTFTKEPYSGFWTRFGIGFLKLLPLDSFL